MNLFYTQPKNCKKDTLVLKDQEAKHAVSVLRYREGDEILVTDGVGHRFEGVIQSTRKKEVLVDVKESGFEEPSARDVTLALGVIKKRDRLEFAVEKAVELGANRIALFRGDHTEKGKVRMDRVEATVMSAMKQSLRVWLPTVELFESMDELLEKRSSSLFVIADQKSTNEKLNLSDDDKEVVLLVGPEGGFSKREEKFWELGSDLNTKTVLLGEKRLRAETAAVVMVLKGLY
ncbi:MAG: RsmE family RNA methyltransferase [Balneolaceae bacterium]